MEPFPKRQKTAQSPADTNEDDDELTVAPDELNRRRDPSFQLERGRALAANKLKFRFEEVIAKYSRDFTGIGDEIDWMTGELVVDNGHVRSMRSEKDTGDGGEDVDEDSDEEEERILRSIRAADKAPGPEPASAFMIPQDPWQVAGPGCPAGPTMGAPSQITSLFSNDSFMTPSNSFSPFGYETWMDMPIDPVWQVPELPESAFADMFGVNGQHLGIGMSSTTRTTVRKCFPPPAGPESDEEDALQSVSGNVLKNAEKESPLIKQKFPAIDSSPNEDPVHKSVVSDLIEHLPATPPSIQRPKITKPRGQSSKLKETPATGSDTEPKERSRRRQEKGAQRDESSPDVNGKVLQASEAKDSGWEEDDLKDFLDITGKNVKPTGQILFVDIRTTKNQSSDPSAIKRRGNKPSRVIENTNAQPPVLDSDSMAMDAPAEQSVTAERNSETPPGSSKKRQPQETFERNVVDPAFAFSGDETMLPRKRGRGRPWTRPVKAAMTDATEQGPSIKNKRAVSSNNAKDAPSDERARSDKVQQSGPDTASVESAREVTEPQAVKDALERNAIDPSFAFSDDEVFLPRRSMRSARKSELATPAEGISKETFSTTRDPNPLAESRAAKAARAALKSCPRRKSGEPVSGSKKAIQDETPLSSMGGEQAEENTSQETLQGADVIESRNPREQTEQDSVAQGQALSENLPPTEQEEDVPAPPSPSCESIDATAFEKSPSLQSEQPIPTTENENARSSSSPSPHLRRSSRRRHSSRELGEPSPPDAPVADAAEAPEESDPISSTTTDTAAAPPPPPPPMTPRRGRPKAAPPKTPPSRALELISLLSDDEDDEDEISFDLTDFTPSGHHRILALRPSSSSYSSSLPRLLASASTTTTTAKKNKNKKKRASLFGPYYHTTPRAPGSAKVKSTGKKKSSLARSVARVRPRRHSSGGHGTAAVGAASPAGSVVQTPGGTKRRCGADGFRCDRDFCFVCL